MSASTRESARGTAEWLTESQQTMEISLIWENQWEAAKRDWRDPEEDCFERCAKQLGLRKGWRGDVTALGVLAFAAAFFGGYLTVALFLLI